MNAPDLINEAGEILLRLNSATLNANAIGQGPAAELFGAAWAAVYDARKHLENAHYYYRGWLISQGRFPEPAWSATGPNYDASYEGPEDGWVDNGEKASAATREARIDEIDAWFEDAAERAKAGAE